MLYNVIEWRFPCKHCPKIFKAPTHLKIHTARLHSELSWFYYLELAFSHGRACGWIFTKKNMFMGLYILQVGGMFTAAQIVTQGTITWPKMLNSIVIKRAFQMLFGGFFPPKEYPPPALRNFFAYNIW